MTNFEHCHVQNLLAFNNISNILFYNLPFRIIATGEGNLAETSVGFERCKRGYLRIKQKGFPKSRWPLLVNKSNFIYT